jgi:hypothetical protein
VVPTRSSRSRRSSDNELFILTASQAWRLSGYLTTRITNDAGGVTYDVHPIPSSPGILSERSIQQTPHGLVFANKFDLYLYRAGSSTRFSAARTASTGVA